MNRPKRNDAILAAKAIEEIKKGIVHGIEITGNNPFLHMSAVTVAVTHYLESYSDTYHIDRAQTLDIFIEGVKTLMKESDPNVS